ncbi:MAG: P27 family phage terminase small subunit [Rhodospirillales bacterium]|nr:P27 family phage terminase small subunit [Rhodospirillales bacterium]
MSIDPITLHRRKRLPQPVVPLAGAAPQHQRLSIIDTQPPPFLLDDIAREEWVRVSGSLPEASASVGLRTLLAGYCNAVARAVRAEQTLAIEGRYYHSTTGGGSMIRRRHPAVQDAEQGWTSARHLAKQLGITGGASVAPSISGARRNLFK